MENEDLKNSAEGNKIRKIIFYFFGVIFFLILIYFFTVPAPKNFPKGIIFNIEPGTSLRSVSLNLKKTNIIKSRVLFEAFAIMYGGEKHIIPADYLFEDKEPVWEVARRISRGDRHLAPVKVTIPEGFNVSDIANIFVSKLVNFNKEKFLSLAKAKEGYLFPDTYFFFTTDTETEALRSMGNNFEKKIALIRPQIAALEKTANKTEKEIITMASIIEKEAKGDTDRGIISGILWKRINIGMPLQVDAVLETYKVKGLPQSPIGNPGLEAILASIHPQSSTYLYYLHDKNGVVHYAKSFAEHQANIKKYLRN